MKVKKKDGLFVLDKNYFTFLKPDFNEKEKEEYLTQINTLLAHIEEYTFFNIYIKYDIKNHQFLIDLHYEDFPTLVKHYTLKSIYLFREFIFNCLKDSYYDTLEDLHVEEFEVEGYTNKKFIDDCQAFLIIFSNGKAIDSVNVQQNKKLCSLALRCSSYSVQYISSKNMTRSLCKRFGMKIVKEDGYLIKFIPYQTKEMQEEAFRQDINNRKYFKFNN